MARVDDKARFYLERSVPQLREFESKEIFSKDEIRTLVERRTEFERLILSPGSQPSDVLTYIAWEKSLDALRAKRCRRLKIHQSTGHASQARIFQTYERGIVRHPGSAALWRQYLDYAAHIRATKRWRGIMTRALRMLPSDAQFWVLAGRRAVQDGDMESARGYFMRGCRFCTADGQVWIEYARAEMEWLVRLRAKKGTPAFAATIEGEKAQGDEDGPDGEIMFDNDDDSDDDDDGDFSNMAVAEPKKKPAAPAHVFSQEVVKKLEQSPALSGAIPQAIFDVAAKQPFFGPAAAEDFFDLFGGFVHIDAGVALVDHVLAAMADLFPDSASTWNCQVKRPLLGVHAASAAFPKALRTALARLQEGLGQAAASSTTTTTTKTQFAAKSTAWIDALLAGEDLDDSLRLVLEDAKRKVERTVRK